MTPRQAAILRMMSDSEEEIVYERGRGYVGIERIAARTVFHFLRCAWIKSVGGKIGQVEYYAISEAGRAALSEHDGRVLAHGGKR